MKKFLIKEKKHPPAGFQVFYLGIEHILRSIYVSLNGMDKRRYIYFHSHLMLRSSIEESFGFLEST